jgi:chromosome segregation ATPase
MFRLLFAPDAGTGAGGTGDPVTPPPADPTATATPPDPGKEAKPAADAGTKPNPDEDWEKRFKGLQPKFQELSEDHKKLLGTYDSEKTTWAGEKSQLETQIDTLNKQIEEAQKATESLTTGKSELEKQIETMNAQAERRTLIMAEYPELARLEAKGLLPKDLEGDELKTALNDIRSLMLEQRKGAIEKQIAGSTTAEDLTTGSRGQVEGVQGIGDKLMEANRAGDAVEVTRLTKLLVNQAQTEVFAQE